MLRKTEGITFNKSAIEKATKNRNPSTFWPILSKNNKSEFKNIEISKEDIKISGSVIKSKESKEENYE